MIDGIEIIYPEFQLNDKQQDAFDLLTDDHTSFILFGGGAEGGKSWLGCLWIILNCYNYPGTRWFIGRKELTRLMTTTYLTFQKVCTYLQIPSSDWKLNGQYHYIEFINGEAKGSRVDLLDLAFQPSDPLFERLGSLEVTGGFIEEAEEVDFMAFDVLKSRIGRWMNKDYGILGKIFLSCNPTKSWLYRIFYKPLKDGILSASYAFIKSLYSDNPFTAKDAGERLDQITDPILRARLKEGLWEYEESSLALIDYDAILRLWTNEPKFVSKKYLTADIAAYGSDKIVIGIWYGLNLVKVIEKSKQGTDVTADDIRKLAYENAIPLANVIVDEEGVGRGVKDYIKGIVGYVANASPIKTPQEEDDTNNLRPENYKNLRAQLSFLFASLVMNGSVGIGAELSEAQKDIIVGDLQQLKRVDTAHDAPLQIISKEEMKASLLRSPDYADMMIMRSYFEIVPPLVYAPYKGPGGVGTGLLTGPRGSNQSPVASIGVTDIPMTNGVGIGSRRSY